MKEIQSDSKKHSKIIDGIIFFNEALLSFHYFGAAFVFTGVYLARKITK